MLTARSVTLAIAALGAACFDCTFAEPARARSVKACSTISKQELASCKAATASDKAIALAKCANMSDPTAIKACKGQASSDAADEAGNCKDERDLRATVCGRLGEAPYTPDFSPQHFTTSTTIDNPLFPLVPGTTFIYEGQTADGFEHDEFSVTHDTKVIDGVTCVEVHDTAKLDGVLSEDTRDWFAQDDAGNVWYCGENTATVLDGLPQSLEGSWTGGVDGAQPGIIMEASPMIGDFYRQEFLVGEAEDMAEVKSLTDSAMVPFGTFANDCLRTEETSTLSPGDVENKYYVTNVGNVLTVDVATGERSELIAITTGN
ncbi:MAG TPA: hypothetical protein VGK30_03795 [Candidatus Binatia bacterium]